MCTVTTYETKNHYFGRNLDLEYSYREQVAVTPRNYAFKFRQMGTMRQHYAMIGMAYVVDGYPLYYDATNEEGLSMAGLNFPGNACYKLFDPGAENIAPFEFIPWILGQCSTVGEAELRIRMMNMMAEKFSEDLPLQPLHWMVSDMHRSIVVEAVAEGIRIYPNPTGTMTNNPTFDHQLFRLNDYRNVTPEVRAESFVSEDAAMGPLVLDAYSRGMGGIGIPGDLSSGSRFVKAVWTRMNSVSDDSELASVSQFFHILSSVEQQRGCCRLGEDTYEITIYSSCCNMERGIYYYRTYDNSQITAVDMHREDLDGERVVAYPLLREQNVFCQN